MNCALRSRGEKPERETAIYVCDTMGELGLFYRLAGVVMVGKSFVGEGGQNPIEPPSSPAPFCTGRASPISPTSMRCSTRRAGRRWRATPKSSRRCSIALFADPARLQGDGARRRQGGGDARRRGRSRDAGARAVPAGREPAGAGVIAPGFWARERPGLAARALQPLGALYGLATARRMARPGARVEAAVICVGNFVVGGAGKTPTAIAVGAHAAKRGRARRVPLARLWRRARGRSRSRSTRRSTARAPSATSRCCWRASRRASSGADRVAAARAAIARGASALVLDDGMQNPSLAKDFTLAVIDGEARFGNGLCLSRRTVARAAGAPTAVRSAEVVVGGAAEALAALRALAPEKPIFRAALEADAIVGAKLVGRPVLAFAGIARPEKFFATLEALGARVAVQPPLRRPPRLRSARNRGADRRGFARAA